MDSKQLVNLVREQGIDVFERMFRAVELVQERLNRACAALLEAQVPYAVVGGNAVAAWVATIDQSVEIQSKSIIKLEALVEMKLNSYRDKDKTHLRDMIDVGLIDNRWPDRFLPQLANRLTALLEDPEGCPTAERRAIITGHSTRVIITAAKAKGHQSLLTPLLR